MRGWMLRVVVLLTLLVVGTANVNWACDSTADSTPGSFICDFSILAKPVICVQAFDVPPQILTLTGVTGVLPGGLFEEFAVFNATHILVEGAPVTLTLDCEYQDLLLVDDAFLGLDWLQRLVFINCDLRDLPRRAFEVLGTLDSLEFYGGSIDAIHTNSLFGFSIARDATLDEPKGQFHMENTALASQRLPPSFFRDQAATISTISIINAHLQLLDAETFNDMPHLVSLDLSRNNMWYLPLGMLNGTNSLGYLILDQLPFDCSDCAVAWFLEWAEPRQTSILGDLYCAKPADHQNTRLPYFYEQSCVEAPEEDHSTGSGIEISIGGSTILLEDLINWVITLLSFILSIVGVIGFCKAKRQQLPPSDNKGRNVTMINLSLMQKEKEWLAASDPLGSQHAPTPTPQTPVPRKPVEIVHLPPDKPATPRRNQVLPAKGKK